ncbi:MAG: hypothetical protein V4634_17995 [Pseudomonadota bacterium]
MASSYFLIIYRQTIWNTRWVFAAIGYSDTPSCPPAGFGTSQLAQQSTASALQLERYPWRNNRIVK